MNFGHEQLDVYRVSLDYVGWVYRLVGRLKAENRNARIQLIRASQSIPLNIAEGNGKSSRRERRRYLEIARGSALECAATQDVLEVGGVLSPSENAEAKKLLIRIVSMLTKMSPPRNRVGESMAQYGRLNPGFDNDNDCDCDNESPQPIETRTQ